MKYHTIREAAVILRLTEEALQTRCRRKARRVGRDIVAELGDGVVAVKLGRTWRVRFAVERAA